MGFRIAKCPACGANLDIETNENYLFCTHCGAKLINDDKKIVVESIHRTIDEAKIKEIELKRYKEEKKRTPKRGLIVTGLGFIIVGILMLVFPIIFLGNYKNGAISFAELGICLLLLGAILLGFGIGQKANKGR